MKDVILITSGKGGVGKSTLSALISLELSKKYNILLIDGDLGLKNLDNIFNIQSNHFDISDVICNHCEFNDALIKISNNLSLINLCISNEVTKYPNDLLKRIISFCNDYDYIIIDSPAGIEQGFLNSITCSNKFVVILNDDINSFEDSFKVQSILKQYDKEDIFYILNRYNAKKSKIKNLKIKFQCYFDSNEILFINELNGNIYNKFYILEKNIYFKNFIKELIKQKVYSIF